MGKAKRVRYASLVVLILLGAFVWRAQTSTAQGPPERRTTIVVSYDEYEWWLIRWEDNEILCRILVDHEGLPTGDEVLRYCGDEVYTEWVNTPPCKGLDEGRNSAQCPGVYLYLTTVQPREKELVVDLPPPLVWVNLEGCTLTPPENRCTTIPTLVLTGEEPLPNEIITAIRGTIDGAPFRCDGDVCKIPLQATPLSGVEVEFWAESSYGDESEHFTAQVRVIDTGVSPAPGLGGWYVDVISTQWQGAPIATCSRIWEAFPPAGGPPLWRSTPDHLALMTSAEPYFYLAGRLIHQGIVDARECPSSGLLPNGYADACGLEKARPQVLDWQNQFDQRIIDVARETGVPAQLMKNLFAQESQFWPGVFRVNWEFGLGQITDNGADSILLWNASFFDQFCPLVLAEDACARGYLGLQPEDQAILRGSLALEGKSDCEDCPEGIDLSHTAFSVSLFANTLAANCAQVNQTVQNATRQTAGDVSNYEDLWRFTVANYHAGSGCTAFAIHQAWESTGILTWEEVASRFTAACQGVVPYVEKITNVEAPVDLGSLAPVPSPTAGTPGAPQTPPAPTPGTPVASPTPGVSPTPTPTLSTGPYPGPVGSPTPTYNPYP